MPVTQLKRCVVTWGSVVEVERRRRILLSVAAYSYEVLNEPLMSDADFDAECLRVDLSVATGNAEMDSWFRKHFEPCTGMWVRLHPNLARLDQIAHEILNSG